MGGDTAIRLTCIVLAVLHLSISASCATSRRQLLQQQGDTTITLPFDQLPPLPISLRQQPQEQPPQQQQGPQAQWQQQQPQAQFQPQQGPPQQQGNRQQASINNLASSSATPSTVAHAPSVAFGAPTPAANVGIQLPSSMQHAQSAQVPAAAPSQAAAAAQAVQLQAAAAAQAAQLQAAAQPPATPEGSACLAATKQLVVGECLPFMAEFQMRGPALGRMSAADFRQAVAIGPTPTDQCCRDAKAFVTQACACNPVAAAAAPSVGLTAEDLQLSAKASVMACPHFGFTDPCAQA